METTETTSDTGFLVGQIKAMHQELLTPQLLEILKTLHSELNVERAVLLEKRQVHQRQYEREGGPRYLGYHRARFGDWKVNEIPTDLLQRRVEITGPINSAKMVINMLNPSKEGVRADMAMLDFEDSMMPSWSNVLNGVKNFRAAVEGTLTHVESPAEGGPSKSYKLNARNHAGIMVRVRGLHLQESNITVLGEPISAGLFDLAACVFHGAHTLMRQGRTPKFYVPKIEHFEEAIWWNRLFSRLEDLVGLPANSIRVTCLIETLPAAFQIEEILFELKDRVVGLNGGRWDKIFSDIKVFRNDPTRVMADRASITMTRPWMDNYAKRLIKICHHRGAFAMGGMSAFTPGREPEVRIVQEQKVREDKAREASIGHDGCWVSHPHFVAMALEQFKNKNQLNVQLTEFSESPDLLPSAEGHKTLLGLRTNIRVGIAYMEGWSRELGCVALDGLMEDLATLEISRAQTWQWLHHRVRLQEGAEVTRELVQQIFKEELEKILNENRQAHEAAASVDKIPVMENSYRAAKEWAERLFLEPELCDFLTLNNEAVAVVELEKLTH